MFPQTPKRTPGTEPNQQGHFTRPALPALVSFSPWLSFYREAEKLYALMLSRRAEREHADAVSEPEGAQ